MSKTVIPAGSLNSRCAFQGNFGEVYRGIFKPKELEVAVKTCHETLSDDAKKKFLQEGRILKQYDHPNIVKFIGIAARRQPVMIVMEYVPGEYAMEYVPGEYVMEYVSGEYVMECVPGEYVMEYVPGEYVMEYVPSEYVMEYMPGEYVMEYVPGEYAMEYVPGEYVKVVRAR